MNSSHETCRFYIIENSLNEKENIAARFIGDGLVTFLYWTSPSVKIRTCVRKPGAGKIYEWCSKDYTTGDPGPASIVIPGSILYSFEVSVDEPEFNPL